MFSLQYWPQAHIHRYKQVNSSFLNHAPTEMEMTKRGKRERHTHPKKLDKSYLLFRIPQKRVCESLISQEPWVKSLLCIPSIPVFHSSELVRELIIVLGAVRQSREAHGLWNL